MMDELPDFPAIKKLANALWHQNVKMHGAAIMIGSGFSRCSSIHVDGTKKLPLWKDFAKILTTELGGENTGLVFSDPLRLAEEYRAYFGQAALNDLIRSEVCDLAWKPGELHTSLLKLPWTDVLTTNWDTLLEQAALSIHAPIYGVVSKQSDLSCVRAPRIVKLHGTIGVTEQFIVAQEDYRKYPQEFATFVNFARQVFIENELCLLGFSGDDPNFLQWVGWVRDQLADHARRIYLVGALQLSAAKRKLLESINIAPIDLWEAVQDIDDHNLRHEKAIGIFLKALTDAKPKPIQNWEPTSLDCMQETIEDHDRQIKDHAYSASLMEQLIEKLRRDRELYPGWLVAPPELRWKIQHQVRAPSLCANNIACLGEQSRTRLLYEIAWQHTISFEPVAPWLVSELANITDISKPSAITKSQQLEIALLLLKIARKNDDSSEFEKWSALLEKNKFYLPDCLTEIAYQKALMAREHFDYFEIESVVEKIVGEDPIWRLRQASMLAELGRFDEGEQLISDAYKELLDRSRHGSNSIRVYSRLAWAHWLFRLINVYHNYGVLEGLPSSYKTLRCDPWDHITYLRDKAFEQQEKHFKNQEDIEPLFEQGHYRDHSSDLRFSSYEIPPSQELNELAESVGLPLRWENMDLLANVAEKLLVSERVCDGLFRYTLAIRTAHTDSSLAIKEIFSRMGVANAPLKDVNILANRLVTAINYWRTQADKGRNQLHCYTINAIRVLTEVLARLVVRLSPEKSKKIFRLALGIGQDSALRHFWLYEVVGHLAEYSLKSIPDEQQSDLFLDTLLFPLACEVGINESHDASRWPNPVIEAQCTCENDPRLRARVSELIKFIKLGEASSTSILLRLLPLITNGILTDKELGSLAIKIWGANPEYKVLPITGLYSHVLLTLPAMNRNKANALISTSMFDADDSLFFTSPHLSGLIGAAASKPDSLFPSNEQAVKCFDRLVSWRPLTTGNDLLGIQSQTQNVLIEDIAKTISYSIMPSLDANNITMQRFEKVLAIFTEIGAFPVIVSLPYCTGLHSNNVAIVEKAIRKGMQGQSAHEIGWSVQALYKWKELSDIGNIPPPSDSVISKMIYLIESGRTVGLHSLLWYAGEIFKNNWLSANDVDVLADCLPDLFDAADYKNIKPTSQEAVTASLIREICVKLAVDLISTAPSEKLTAMIESSVIDALPEVRFAGKQ